MRALILNSGKGTRLGHLTEMRPKCMVDIGYGDTVLSRQLRLLNKFGVTHVVLTTGPFSDVLESYCYSLGLNMNFEFVFNPLYGSTNYIYSIYLARKHVDDDVLLCHGDLVFAESVLSDLLGSVESSVAVSYSEPLSPKDFKAVIEDGLVKRIGVEFFDQAVAAQPLYKLSRHDWMIWLESIKSFCETGQVSCYAEAALNEVTDRIVLRPVDFGDRLCHEIDTVEDLVFVRQRLQGSNWSV